MTSHLPIDVVLEGDAHQEKEHAHPDEARDLAHAQRKRPPQHPLDGEEHEVPAVEHRDGQQVEEPEVDADDRHRPDEVVGAPRALPRRRRRRW